MKSVKYMLLGIALLLLAAIFYLMVVNGFSVLALLAALAGVALVLFGFFIPDE